MSAVVQENHITAADSLGDFLFDHSGWRGIPIVSGDVPHHWLHPEFTRDMQCRWPASAKRWTEKIGVLADSVLQRIAAGGQLSANFRCALENQQRMGEGVIADCVPSLDNFAHDIGALA